MKIIIVVIFVISSSKFDPFFSIRVYPELRLIKI